MGNQNASNELQVIEPPEDFEEFLKFADFLREDTAPALLLGPDGEQVKLPLEIYEILRKTVAAMERGVSVSIEPIDKQLTTQDAANVLGISRNTLVRLLNERELPFERLGSSRHRRLRLRDVLAYQKRKKEETRTRLDEMTRKAADDGLYEATSEEYAEALRAARRS